jgi:uncharacterized membrane protein
MNTIFAFLLTIVLLAVVDFPWLSLIGGPYMDAIRRIQGGAKPVVRYFPAFLVYVALAFLVRKTETIQEAFLVGAATYAVYDFTVMALFKDYPLSLAISDTLWGGVLFAITRFLLDKFRL